MKNIGNMIQYIKEKLRRYKIYQNIKNIYNNFNAYKVTQEPSDVTMHNYLSKPAPQDYWLRDFIISRGLLKNSSKKISIFSVFGSKLMMRLNKDDIKIFIARENVHREQWKDYEHNCLDVSSIDLSLGFDYGDSDRYMRFPLWIMWLFPPDVDYAYIKQWCERVNRPDNASYDGRKFCAFLCSHDDIGRQEIYDQLSSIDRVDCDGRLFHNNDELKQIFNDDKLAYLRNYRFNLCPENSSEYGYVTEKIFEAIDAGCIPIYSGNAGAPPEPDIINPEAFIFIDMLGDNSDALEKIQVLNNREEYMEFTAKPRLREDAADRIWGYIQKIEYSLRCLIES